MQKAAKKTENKPVVKNEKATTRSKSKNKEDKTKNEKSTNKEKVDKEITEQVKKVRNSYLFFSQEHREMAKKENPEMSQRHIMTLLAKMWKECSLDDRKKYEEMAVKDKERYKRETENAGKTDPKVKKTKQTTQKDQKGKKSTKKKQDETEVESEEEETDE